MMSTAQVRRPAEAVGAGRLVGGQPGLSAGLSGPEGCDGKLQAGSQAKRERIRSRTTAMSRMRRQKRPVELL